jgi:SAM-dependent methyltransferase
MAFKQLVRNLVLMAIYPRPLIGLAYLPKYIGHWLRFNRLNKGEHLHISDAYPNLGDWVSSTPFDPHYFYQSAWLARRLASSSPKRHLDIGSDVKVVGTISAFIPTEFMDFRPLDASLPGLECTHGDILHLPMEDDSIMSLSCLHVVEHIGLGRYGDPIDPEGSRKALAELERVISVGGRLYLSVPVGQERICFNAHRIFSPQTIVDSMPSLTLREFSMVNDAGRYLERQSLTVADGVEYGCGMFCFEKIKPNQTPE